MSNLKYELTGETVVAEGDTLYRIKALRDIPSCGVRVGQLGGFIRSASNLSHGGDAWVAGFAQVSGGAFISGDSLVGHDARIGGSAIVGGKARISGKAWISDDAAIGKDAQIGKDAWIGGSARIGGEAMIYGNARISGSARIDGSARIGGDSRVIDSQSWLLVGPVGSRRDYLTCSVGRLSLQFATGCFAGDGQALREAIKEKHGYSVHATNFLAAVDFLSASLGPRQASYIASLEWGAL